MAIAFVLMVGAISAGLVSLAASGLGNRNTLQVLRNRQYAADGAVVQAITAVRLLSCTPTTGSLVDSSVNAISIRVDWVNVCGVVQGGDVGSTATAAGADGTVVAQRNVVFSACVNTGSACLSSAVIIRAVVNFQQAHGAGVTRTYVQTWSVNQ
jgi:hypothetical protein